jgi:hypothetical protein
MNGLSYQRLEKIMNSVPHYRGNKDRFPLGARRQNNKYFLVREEGGSRVFDVVYGNRWERRDIDEAEYKAREAQGDKRIHCYANYDDKGKPTGKYEYMWHESVPNVVGTVRSDETFQFTKNIYYQGERGFLSQFSTGWFTTKSRHGGMLYTSAYHNKFVPLWKNMKINIGDMTPTEPYKVVIHHVDRKKSKELLKEYEHFLKVSEVMVKNMDMKTLTDTGREVVNEVFKDAGEDAYKQWHKLDEYLAAAQVRMNDAPLDALVLFLLGYEVGRFGYMLRWSPNTFSLNEESTEALFMAFKRKFSKEIYKLHREIFNEVEYEGGKAYPACDWGVKIIVNGKEVEQYE